MADLSRLHQLQSKIIDQGADAFLVTQNIDLYYYTGSMQQGYLFVPASGDPIFYVRRSVSRAMKEANVQVKDLGSFRAFGKTLASDYPSIFQKNRPILLTEFDVLPVQLFQRLQSVIPDAEWADGSKLIREQRMLKSADEIQKIKEAGRLVDYAMNQAVANMRPGMTELELIQNIEYHLRGQGHHGIMRMRAYNQEIITGMVAAGRTAAEPTYFEGPAGGQGLSAASPQGSSRREIQAGEPILIDIGCNLDGYVIDQTRTAVFGSLSEKLTKAYEWCESVLRQTESNLKPGVKCDHLYVQALQEAEYAGYSEHFMGYGQDRVRFLGHGIGMEIDEWPVLAKGFEYELQPGMVIAIEPKLIFPGEGVVGIENSYAVTETGFEKLTISKEGLWVIER